MNVLQRLWSRMVWQRALRAPEVEAAARAKRARDHLARKRERERSRLSRDRSRHANELQLRGLLRIGSPVAFFAAMALGATWSAPIGERLAGDRIATERVAVQGAERLSPAEVAAATGLGAGIRLDAVDPARVAEQLRAHPWIEEARALRLPTGTLLVSVVERDAVARWRDAQETAWVDAQGSRFGHHRGGRPVANDPPQALFDPGALPTVEGGDPLASVLPDEAMLILREARRHAVLAEDPAALTLRLPGLETDADGVLRASPDGFVLEVGPNGPRALLGRRLLSQRVARLAALLEHDEETARAARLIDLRYADRAVLRSEPAPG